MVVRKEDMEYLKKYLTSDKYEDGVRLLESGKPVQYVVGDRKSLVEVTQQARTRARI